MGEDEKLDEELEDTEDLTRIDLTDEVNAAWRDLLRKNPNDPRFRHPTIKEIHLTPVERLSPEELKKAQKKTIA
jgi:hypothetical protein